MKNETKKQVAVEKYNKEYYEGLYISPDYAADFDWSTFGDIYKEMANILPLSKDSVVVDFGCGNGEQSFCLYKKYGCSVTGIDYSEDAIGIAKENLEKLYTKDPSATVSFVNNNNDALPILENIDVVYFCDVVEHMYDSEIALVMEQVKQWNRQGKIKAVVHTDNTLFLDFVRPFLDSLSVLCRVSTVRDIKKRNAWENERHVNLTNPRRFKRTMENLGFYEVTLRYPEISLGRVERQLGKLGRVPGLSKALYAGVKMFQFLSPSFYAVYEYTEKK